MTAPAAHTDRPPKGPPQGWVYTPRDTPPSADQAACTPEDADRLLYSDVSGRRGAAILDEARLLCQSCPVQAECLDYSLTADERWGVWAGLSANERGDMRRRLKLPPVQRRTEPLQLCGTEAAHTRHLRAGEKPCRACKEAHEAYRQLRRDPGRVLVGAGRGSV